MMRKFLLMLMALFVATPGFSALRITDNEAFKYVMEKHFPGDTEVHVSIATAYRDQVLKDNTTDSYHQGLVLCKAAGLTDIGKGGAHRAKCREFVADLMWKSTGFYLEVCNGKRTTSGTTGASYDCVTDPFNYTNVQLASAITLAKEYARVRFGDTIVCTDKYRKDENDDWVKCKALNRERYYEFKFDDVRESVDRDITQDIVKGIYRIHTKAVASLVSDASQTLWVTVKDKSVCDKMGESAKLFGYGVTYAETHPRYAASTGRHGCGFDVSSITSASELSTAYGIDPFDTCRDIQMNMTVSLQDALAQYVVNHARKAGVNISVNNVRCDSAARSYTGKGCKAGTFSGTDDVLSCYVNGKTKIDFVFDDLSEFSKRFHKGGLQGVQCLAADGSFDGERCTMLGQEQCTALAELNAETCPDCKTIYWDAQNKECILGAAVDAKKLQKQIEVATAAGLIVGTVVITVATGGTALAYVGTGLVVVGSTTAMVAEEITDKDIMDKIHALDVCNHESCAEEHLKNTLTTLNGLKLNMDAAQARAADDLVAKLFGLLPPDSEYLAKIIEQCVDPAGGDEVPEGCPLYEKNYTASQIVGWVGRGLEFIGGAILVVDGFMQWTKSSATITQRIDDLKRTGWVRQSNGQWKHMTTGEVLDKLPRRGVIGWDPNPNLRGGGRWRGHMYGNGNQGSFTKHAEVVEYVKVIDGAARAPNWLEIAAGTAAMVDALPDKSNATQFVLPAGGAQEEMPGGSETPDVGTTPGGNENPGAGTTPGGNENPGAGTTPGGNENPGAGTTPVGNENPGAGTTPVGNETPSGGATPTVETKPASVNISHTVEKKSNTGLIATAAVLGTVGAGFLIGGLVGKNGDNKNAATSVADDKMAQELDELMRNASGAFGFITGNALKLVPLPTTNGTMAPIVRIGGRAVAVVEYRGHRFPFWVNSASARWEPLLGIGANGGWFNTCPNPAKSDISFIDTIAGQMNTKLSPKTVLYFAGPNASGSNFPDASESAYTIINTEFPNGVVQSFNGGMSPADQMLYNNNYNRIKNLFNTAQIWAVFYCGYSVV